MGSVMNDILFGGLEVILIIPILYAAAAVIVVITNIITKVFKFIGGFKK